MAQRDAELKAYQRGQRPSSPPNAVPLLVIGMDGGRYQGREENPETHSRWREEKVLTVSSYIPVTAKTPTKEAAGRRSWSPRIWQRRSR